MKIINDIKDQLGFSKAFLFRRVITMWKGRCIPLFYREKSRGWHYNEMKTKIIAMIYKITIPEGQDMEKRCICADLEVERDMNSVALLLVLRLYEGMSQ